VRKGEWDLAEAYLLEKARLAKAGGADILICMSNTMHKVLSRISYVISIPFIHIATPKASAIKKQQLSSVGLLGTLPVMAVSYMRKH
jgi:aspartate racemase